MEQMLTFGSKAVKYQYIEAVTTYNNEVTVYTANNHYTVYYDCPALAKKAYEEILKKIEARGS